MNKNKEFRLIVTGNFADINEAKHALQDPFIEDFVEETGKFSFNNFEDIRVTNRISLSDLEIAELEEGVYEITCPNAQVILNHPKAEKLAETFKNKRCLMKLALNLLIKIFDGKRIFGWKSFGKSRRYYRRNNRRDRQCGKLDFVGRRRR